MNCFVEIRLVFRLDFMCKTVFKTVFETVLKTVLKIVFKTVFKTVFKPVFKTVFKTVFENNRLYLIKTCHFLKLQILRRENIQQNFLSERVSDVNTQYELSKLSKPVTDMQNDLKEGLVSELKPIREDMKNLLKAVTFPQFHL